VTHAQSNSLASLDVTVECRWKTLIDKVTNKYNTWTLEAYPSSNPNHWSIMFINWSTKKWISQVLSHVPRRMPHCHPYNFHVVICTTTTPTSTLSFYPCHKTRKMPHQLYILRNVITPRQLSILRHINTPNHPSWYGFIDRQRFAVFVFLKSFMLMRWCQWTCWSSTGLVGLSIFYAHTPAQCPMGFYT